MQHFNPDPPELKVFFRDKLINLLEQELSDPELLDKIKVETDDFVEKQRLINLRTYAKDMKVLH